MDDLVFPCAVCLLIGFLGGFTFGFRVAAMLQLSEQPAVPAVAGAQLGERQG
jgi:uncharacterized protein YneF (UPF0154 family)